MKIKITKHFKERVSERYFHNLDDKFKLRKIIERFKEVMKSISKKDSFCRIQDQQNWTFKLFDDDIAILFSKSQWEYTLITFWNRNKTFWKKPKPKWKSKMKWIKNIKFQKK